jgi:glutamate/tyrosine decarboxylase-like PLP-dependent enzyme
VSIIYYPGDDVVNVAREAYGMFMMESALATLAFPSIAQMEQELVEAAIELFDGSSNACSSLTSGGTSYDRSETRPSIGEAPLSQPNRQRGGGPS